jgi:hypothetical protein
LNAKADLIALRFVAMRIVPIAAAEGIGERALRWLRMRRSSKVCKPMATLTFGVITSERWLGI